MKISSVKQYDSASWLLHFCELLHIVTEEVAETFQEEHEDEWDQCETCGHVGTENCECCPYCESTDCSCCGECGSSECVCCPECGTNPSSACDCNKDDDEENEDEAIEPIAV